MKFRKASPPSGATTSYEVWDAEHAWGRVHSFRTTDGWTWRACIGTKVLATASTREEAVRKAWLSHDSAL